ncbi:MAG: AmmeMemoRadiSam system protein B [Desulfuromonas sp.]|nr:MAG: AmmeMemoRadiSam system protein B [Desulfuromonas sp.]
MIRSPAVAGQFYPDQPEKLVELLQTFCSGTAGRISVPGIVAPHAGYIYSGAIAGKVFSRVVVPDKVIVIGPNHQGTGHVGAVFGEGSWRTPLGQINIDSGLAARIIDGCRHFSADVTAHRFEHSLEVQIPFIQYLNPSAQVVPICIGHLPLDTLIEAGESIADVITASGEPVLIIASSDMTHFESADAAKRKDTLALERVEKLDPEGLYGTVRDNRISMCGVLPTVMMLAAARKLGAEKGEVVAYGTSGDVTGDNSDVVGYAGVVVS